MCKAQLTIVKDLLMKGNALYIPTALRKEILLRIHDGHMGIHKSIQRARDVVWWPGFTNDIKGYVSRCTECLEQKPNRPEPLIPSTLPQLPWEVVATDLAQRNGKDYLIIIDYYSRYPEVFLLPNSTASSNIIGRMKSAFARHGIPREVRSDNGPQYVSTEFQKFAQEYGFIHVKSSPRFPQSNGLVEGAVKIVKNIISRSSDPYIGLLSYRNSPLAELKYSPAQLLMGRKLRDTLPSYKDNLQPKTINTKDFKKLNKMSKLRQKRDYDRHQKVYERSDLIPLQKVWITDYNRYGVVKEKAETPRSYIVESEGKKLLRRNSYHLKEVPCETNKRANTTEEERGAVTTTQEDKISNDPKESDAVQTRSGRLVRKPDRLNL